MDWVGHKYQFGRAVADREDVGKRSIFDCGTEITHLTFNNVLFCTFACTHTDVILLSLMPFSNNNKLYFYIVPLMQLLKALYIIKQTDKNTTHAEQNKLKEQTRI